ncbi:MAG: hypothetical protein RLZZ200_2335 [Pseudomonadota bacterium]|jgi:Xaa-Pro dipeptidase
MTAPLGPDGLHPAHLAEISARSARALEACGFDSLWIHAGSERTAFLDDQTYPFRPNPHFSWWVPLPDAPDSLLQIRPGHRPRLLFHCSRDFWHLPPSLPEADWVRGFDIQPVASWPEVLAALPPPDHRTAVLGEPVPALEGLAPAVLNPPTLLRWLHEQRVRKTDFERACLREASRLGAKGHVAARAAQDAGDSEFGVHQAFLAACGQREMELPYRAIVARGTNAATLHYQNLERARPGKPTSLLIDAGASFRGYGSDITRTRPARSGDDFAALVSGLDRLQQSLCARVKAGLAWPQLHLDAHHGIASLLRETGVLRISADAAVDSGLTSLFLPHGLGHLLGLQVHDVGGFHDAPLGEAIPPPPRHPALRLTRRLQEGMVVTLEPGIYFIDALLGPARHGPKSSAIDWNRIDQLRPHGGIRIEDNLLVTGDGSENLTRQAFAALSS